MSSKRLEGKIAVITGGNSGIGLATAKEFIAEGAIVTISGRDPVTLEAAGKELGNDALVIQSDASKLADIDHLIAKIKERFGRIDTLFINAGIGKFGPFETMSEAIFDQTFDINLKGPYFTIQKALPLFERGGSIILNGSINGLIGMPNSSIYAASKAALRSLARTLSAELVDKGIRVNVVSPGPVTTPIYSKLGLPAEELEKMANSLIQQIPMKRFADPTEIAKTVLFLASEDSSFLLGSEIVADGGMSQL